MVCHIDCSDIRDSKQLHGKLKRFMRFPDWYGHNLDALYDCLTELPSPTRLFLSNWDSTVPWASAFEAVLSDAQQDCPVLKVIFE